MSKEFTLNGGVEEENGFWQAEILLKTPDGKQTKLESGFIYRTKDEAEEAMKLNLNRILSDFTTNHEVEVLAKNGVQYS